MSSRSPGGKAQADYWIIAALVAYAMINALGRAALADAVELDSAEQVLVAQEYRWGYANQPPLYSWVQATAFQLLGTNAFSLALVKGMFLFLAYAFTYATTKRVTQSTSLGLLVVTSLVFIPQFAWELQRDLTHSAALVACVAATIYFSLRIMQKQEWTSYMALGCCFGLGILSKYNYALFPPALILGWLSTPECRASLLQRRFLIVLGVALALVTPHLTWLWQTRQEMTAATFGVPEESGGLLTQRWESLVSLGGGILLSALPLAAVYFCASRGERGGERSTQPNPYFQRVLGRALIAGLLFCFGLSLVFGTHFKDRLLLPVLLSFPLVMGLIFGPGLSPKGLRIFTRVNICVALGLIIAAPLATVISARMGRPNRGTAPYRAIGMQLKGLGIAPGVILAENRWMGGNLKLQFPDSVVFVRELPISALPPAATNYVLAWNAGKGERPSSALLLWAKEVSGLDFVQPAYVEAPYRHARKQTLRLGIMIAASQPGSQ